MTKNTLFIGLLIALIFQGFPAVHAQTYYSPPAYTSPSYTSPAAVAGTYAFYSSMSLGSRGGEVSQLQQALISLGYYSGPVTGYFGSLTRAAVMNYQRGNGISATGIVGPMTRAKLNGPAVTPPPAYNPPVYNPPSYSVNLTSLQSTTGAVGALVTIYGTGLTQNNDIHIVAPNGTEGGVQNLNISANGTLSFLFPRELNPCVFYGYGPYSYGSYGYSPYTSCYSSPRPVTSGSYSIYVTNQNGRSNSLTFFVSGSPTLAWPQLDRISPSTGAVGAQVTIYGQGFTFSGNTVNFGPMTVPNVYSYDGRTLVFTVPYMQSWCGTQYCGYGTYPIWGGVFDVTVTNSNGTSNVLHFTLTSQGGGSGSVTLYSLEPTTGSPGTMIVLRGSGFTSYGNDVHFAEGGVRNVGSSDGATLRFWVPYTVSACDFWSGSGCSYNPRSVTSGMYPIYVSNANGQSATLNFFVP